MEVVPREIEICQRLDGSEPFTEWLETLDARAEAIVLKRLERISDGLFGECRTVGNGISELKIDYGPGYRVYFGQSNKIVYVISGGSKRTQQKDIEAAQQFWSGYGSR